MHTSGGLSPYDVLDGRRELGIVSVSRVLVVVVVDACGVMVVVGLNTFERLVTVLALRVWIGKPSVFSI